MITLDEPIWKTLKGGYRINYDVSPALKVMEQGGLVWSELWENLHHQGDVDIASYAAVPHVVRLCACHKLRDWNFYGLIATIEIQRHQNNNPAIPNWLLPSYKAAWSQLLSMAVLDIKQNVDPVTLQTILSVIALAKGNLKLGALLSHLDSSEIDNLAEELIGWEGVYHP